MLTTPGGKPASTINLATCKADNGVCSAIREREKD